MYKPEQFLWLKERRKNVYSQFGEDGLLEAIFERIGAANRWCCECGAADGVFFSNTRALITNDYQWSAVLIEADAEQFHKLKKLYASPGRVVARAGSQSYIEQLNPRPNVKTRDDVQKLALYWTAVGGDGESSFDALLQNAGAPLDLDLLVIDVDGQDYWLFNSLLKYKPRVVMVEYDPAVDRHFIPPLNGDGQAGLNAITNLGIGKYYWPVAITPTNVIFVQQELCPMLLEPQSHLHESESGSPVCVHCGLSGVWPLVGKSIASKQPEIGKLKQLHQVHAGQDACFRCGKPMADWQVMEECPGVSGPKLAAVMSTPRLGFLATMDCIFQGLAPFSVPLLRGEGAFWHHSLERAIERAIAANAELVLTFDYDVVFNATFGQNEIAKLVCLMEDHPDVDCIVAAQMKREGGPLLASTAQQVRLLDPLIPITQGHFGLTIFRASAFKKLPKPWFRDWPNEAGEWNENRVDADIHFWKQAVDAGLNVQMSLDVLIGHLELIVTWPGQNLQPVYQPLNDWRERGKPGEAFDRQRVIEAVQSNPALLYAPKLEMGG